MILYEGVDHPFEISSYMKEYIIPLESSIIRDKIIPLGAHPL